nr:MAG TPA: hypothetical protein [Caudoviricetes sp.]
MTVCLSVLNFGMLRAHGIKTAEGTVGFAPA